MCLCAWCGKSMGPRLDIPADAITHGICPKCREEQLFKVARDEKTVDLNNEDK